MSVQHQGPGTYFDGATAARHAVTLTIGDTALAIAAAEGVPLTRWDYSDIEMLPAPPDRLHLGLSNGSSARLDVRDATFAQTVREHLGLGAPHHHAGERRRRRLVIAWSAAATAAVLLIGIAGLPALAELALPLIPRSWEQELGPQQHHIAMSSFEEQGPFECGDEGTMERAGKAVFLKMFRRMEAAANLPIPLHPFVIRTAENGASTLPGGYIHIDMGLILDTQTPDELAGIIAHELGHVANRDTLREVLHTAGVAYLFGMAIGDVTGSAGILLAGQMLDYRSCARRRLQPIPLLSD